MLKETWLTDLTQHAEHEIFIMDADTLAFCSAGFGGSRRIILLGAFSK